MELTCKRTGSQTYSLCATFCTCSSEILFARSGWMCVEDSSRWRHPILFERHIRRFGVNSSCTRRSSRGLSETATSNVAKVPRDLAPQTDGRCPSAQLAAAHATLKEVCPSVSLQTISLCNRRKKSVRMGTVKKRMKQNKKAREFYSWALYPSAYIRTCHKILCVHMYCSCSSGGGCFWNVQYKELYVPPLTQALT
jgi:hypothetical protein